MALDPGINRNIEMEMCALGAMMMQDNKATETGLRLIQTSQNLSRRSLQLIFDAIAALWRRKQAGVGGIDCIDAIIVTNLLRRQGHLDNTNPHRINSADVLACVELCPGAANIAHYCTETLLYAITRHLQQACRDTYEEAGMPDSDPLKLINSMHDRLDQIAALYPTIK